MMLQALCELAVREGLVEDSSVESRRVDFILRIDATGRLLAVVPTHDEDGRAKDFVMPRLPRRTVKVSAALVADNATYVLGIDKGGAGGATRAARCADAFRDELEALSVESSDAGLNALRAFIRVREKSRAEVFLRRAQPEWTGSEWLAFQLEGDEGLIHERPSVSKLLRLRSKQEGAGAQIGQCLVTGRTAPLARLHPVVKGIPGAQTAGASVVSFNNECFRSHGLKKGQNAPIGIDSANAYTASLNWLLAPHASRRHRYGVDVPGGVLVFWTRRKDPTPDAIASLFDPSPDQVRQLAESFFTGLAPGQLDAEPFYAVTLSAHSRVIVRDWLETTTGEIKNELRAFWSDLDLEGPIAPRPLWKMLANLEDRGGHGLSPHVASGLMMAAFRGTPFPRELLGAALRRLRLPTGPHDREALRDRCSIVKALLNRQFRSSNRKEVSVSLDESCRETPYLLGRLFAVLERLQGAALGDVNASIRDRFFGSASATPALIFPRLLKLSVHHAAKAERSGWLEKIKSEIVDCLPAQKFPLTLPLEDQGLFAIGYYHQRQSLWRPHDDTGSSQERKTE